MESRIGTGPYGSEGSKYKNELYSLQKSYVALRKRAEINEKELRRQLKWASIVIAVLSIFCLLQLRVINQQKLDKQEVSLIRNRL